MATVCVEAADPDAGLALLIELEVLPSGLVRHRSTLTNTAGDTYEVADLALSLPVPPVATEVLDLAGRWAREWASSARPGSLVHR